MVFGVDSKFKRLSEMRVIYGSKLQRQHELMKKLLIPICKHSSGRYYFNILRIIAIIYHIYIESE